jgi:hypothetical protein
MTKLLCLSNLTELDWIAIGSIATSLMAVATFITLIYQRWQFRKTRTDENERELKNSSVQLILDFGKEFQELEECRKDVSRTIIEHKVLEDTEIRNYSTLKNFGLEDIYDFFDTLGFYVQEKYIKAEIVHHYFDHWFSKYYKFYEQYNVKKLSGYEATVWDNLHTLSKLLNEVEIKKRAKPRQTISKSILETFFTDETNL